MLDAKYDEFFKNHKVTHHDDNLIIYKEPNSSNGWMHFLRHTNHLIILGDYGDAIYKWSEVLDFDFYAGCNFDYFFSRIISCPRGSNNGYDKTTDEKDIKRFFAEYEEQLGKKAIKEIYIDDWYFVDGSIKGFVEFLDQRGIGDYVDWIEILLHYIQKPCKEIYLHHEGLRRAMKEIKAINAN